MLHYQIKGQGPGLFFLHGFLEDAEIWDRIVGPLSLNYTCIQIDFPGYGAGRPANCFLRLAIKASDGQP